MTTENIGLFQALNAKIDYLSQNHKLIASNIANADTPNYRPMELEKVDFSSVMSRVIDDNKVRQIATHARHMPAYNQVDDASSGKQRKTYEASPSGNAVIMEEQLVKSNEVTMEYNLMLNLYKKNVSLIKTAIGK